MPGKSVRKDYLNTRLPIAQRVDALISQMTLEEKVTQMVHTAPAIPRLGVPEYNWWNECLHGVARAGVATVFPQAIGMAASFDDALLYRVGVATSDEARAKHHQALRQGNRGQYFGLTFWSPNINLFRDPRWGRGQETYGECPYLTSRMAVAFITGLQGDSATGLSATSSRPSGSGRAAPKYLKVAACAKHYAVHSGPEPLRHRFDARISGRDLRETYLRAFEAAVREARVEAVMGAYNRVNGEPCCASPRLIEKILREEWSFAGHFLSDCGAVNDFHAGHGVTKNCRESAALAVRRGCDLNCGCEYPELAAALGEGLISEADLDRCLRRLFTTRMKLGMFEPEKNVPFAKIPARVVHGEAHVKLARRMAQESIVLLKNNGILPLRKDCRQLFVCGPNALDPVVLLGNYNGFAPQMNTILAGILDKVAAGTQVQWSKGCDVAGDRPVNEEFKWLTGYAPPVDAFIAVVGYNAFLEGEEGTEGEGGGDRTRYGLPGRQPEYLEKLKALGKPLIVVVCGGSPVDLSWAQEHAAAILYAWYPGEQGGNAVADVLFGDYNPAGRLPITFPRSYDQLPAFDNYEMKGRTYRFMEREPLYRFGYGLSYTTFGYNRLRVTEREGVPLRPSSRRSGIASDSAVAWVVGVDVKNTGRRAGDEVVQLYVSDVQASVPVPRHHLEGFRRVHLRPGQKKTVTFTLTPAQLVCYDDAGQPVVEPGEFRISIGGGQPDDPHGGAVSATLVTR